MKEASLKTGTDPVPETWCVNIKAYDVNRLVPVERFNLMSVVKEDEL